MCREGQLVTTRDGTCEKPGADESPPASPREPSRSEVRMGRLLEGAASALGLAEAAVHEARLLLADRGLLRAGRARLSSPARSTTRRPRPAPRAPSTTRSAGTPTCAHAARRSSGWSARSTAAAASGASPRARLRRRARPARGLDGADLRAAREYAERHRDSGRSPIVVAAAALVEAGGASTREAARAAGITTVGIQVCIKAFAAA
eukprot:tig00000760_g3947.t1